MITFFKKIRLDVKMLKKRKICSSNLNKYIDIHCHILPGIDDGAKNYRVAVKMARMAVEAGISRMIVTPHYSEHGNLDHEEIFQCTEQLQERLDEKSIPIRLYPGNELLYSSSLLEEVKDGKALTLAGSDYVLLEFGIGSFETTIQNAVEEFRNAGYYPVIAHVERYDAFVNNLSFAVDIVKRGAYLQINSRSLEGSAGWKIKRFTRKLIKKNLVSFIATDSHEFKKRTPQFGKSIKWIEKKYGYKKVCEYLIKNPRKIIKNEKIEIDIGE